MKRIIFSILIGFTAISVSAQLMRSEELEKYAKEQGFTNLAHYTDDGDSGTLFWMKYLMIFLIRTGVRKNGIWIFSI